MNLTINLYFYNTYMDKEKSLLCLHGFGFYMEAIFSVKGINQKSTWGEAFAQSLTKFKSIFGRKSSTIRQ